MKRPSRPEIWILSGLILALIPTSVGLLAAYLSLGAPPPAEPELPLPDREYLRGLVRDLEPAGAFSLRLLYDEEPALGTGIARVYRADIEGKGTYYLVVLRHNIACEVCRDIVAVAIYDRDRRRLAGVYLSQPWEVRGRAVDTRPFLDQFSGWPLETPIRIGANADGITGATKSTRGLAEQLNEAAAWIAAHAMEEPAGDEILAH